MTSTQYYIQTFLAIVLLCLRWGFSAALSLLAIRWTIDNPGYVLDPEQVLPDVLANCLPMGGKGFVVAAILAAGMTTFDSTINKYASVSVSLFSLTCLSASSYWTVDIYQGAWNPRATKSALIWQARISTVAIMLLGWLLSLMLSSINEIWAFVTMTLGGATTWPAFFAWYWDRFNGYGYCAGVGTGFVGALLLYFVWPNWTEMNSFALSSGFAIVGCVITTYLTEPTPPEVLDTFYRKTRTPGAWNTVAKRCFGPIERRAINRANYIDLSTVFITLPAQAGMYFASMLLVAQNWTQAGAVAGIVAVLGVGMHYFLFNRLSSSVVNRADGDDDEDEALLQPIL